MDLDVKRFAENLAPIVSETVKTEVAEATKSFDEAQKKDKDKVLRAIRALSNLEWCFVERYDIPSWIIWEHIDYLFEYLKEDLEL